jgi:putative peptide zinc metalloprotease protein
LEIKDDVKIEFYKISFRKENDFYVVWKENSSNFIEIPESSFLTLELLQQGKTPDEVTKILKNKYQEEYDVKDFLQELIKLGFVRSIDGIPFSIKKEKTKTFSFIKKEHISWIYSKPLLILYFSVIGLAATILILNPVYFPSYSDLFFTDSYLVVLTVSFAVSLGLVFIHEVSHLLAGKAAGVDGYFSIGLRLYIPVAETNLTQLWSLPRKKRFIPFLAGMITDAVICSLLIFLIWFSDSNLIILSDFVPFAKMIILVLYYSLFWQFLLFIRTDLYYVISNLFGCRNLYGDSWSYVLSNFLRLFKGKKIKLQIPKKEQKIVRIYAPLMLVATVFSVLFFAFWGLPIFLTVFFEGVNLFSVGIQGNLEPLLEGFVLICLTVLQIFGFLFFLIRGSLRLKSGLISKS